VKLCPECKSDSIEKSYSIGLRVVGCIILLFIPFGIFFCWIPFVFPYTYRCKVCGTDVKEEELIDIDWREKEIMLEQYKIFEGKLAPLLDKWFLDEEKVYKIVKAKGQFLLLVFTDNDIYPSRIVNYINENGINKFTINKKLTSEFHLFKNQGVGIYDVNNKEVEEPQDSLSSFGKQVISENELLKYKYGKDSLIEWLKQDGKFVENIEIVS